MRSAWDRLRMFSFRELSQNRGRVLASAVVVAICTALLVTVLSIIASIDRSIDNAGTGFGPDAQVEVSASSDAGLPQAIARQLASAPEVATAVPLVQTAVQTNSGSVVMVGLDASAAALRSPLQAQFGGVAAQVLATPDGVLAGPATGLRAGSRVRVGSADVTIAAVPSGTAARRFNNGRYLVAPLPLAQRATGRPDAVDSVLVVARADTDPAIVRAAVERVVAGRGIVDAPAAQRGRSSNGVDLIRYVALSSAALTFLVAAFLIYTATSMALAARRPRISMLRALGGTRRMVVGDLLADTAVVSVVGALVGSALGFVLARTTIGRLPDLFLQSLSTRIEFAFPPWIVPTAVVVTAAVCVVAAGIAARQVYRVSPVEALAPVRTPGTSGPGSRARIVAGILAPILAVVAYVNATRQPGILANSGITVMFAAEIALGYALTGPIVAAASYVARVFGRVGVLAAETIRRTPTRTWATLMTVSVAVAATLAISAGNSNAVSSTEESFAPLRNADVWVSTTPAGQFPTGPQLTPTIVDGVRAVPGVIGVVAEQARYVSVGDQRALTYGVTEGAANPLVAAADDAQRAQVLAGQGVVLSRDLSESVSADVGDEVSLATGSGPRRLKVVAVVPFFSALNGAMAMSKATMADLFGDDGATALAVRVAPNADPADVLSTIRAGLPPGTYAYSGEEAVDGFGSALDQATALNHLIWIIVTIIAGVALLNTLLMSVLERRRELGVLRALGSSRRFIVGTVAAEALAVGIAGGLLGVAFGLLQQVIADLASSRAWSVDVAFAVTPVSLVLALGALLVCVSGAAPPAARVSRLNIIETTRVE